MRGTELDEHHKRTPIEPIRPDAITQSIGGATATFAGIVKACGQPLYREDEGFPGDPKTSRVAWEVGDKTGAWLSIVDDRASERTPAETTDWIVAWIDGPGHPGSGRRLFDYAIGATAG